MIYKKFFRRLLLVTRGSTATSRLSVFFGVQLGTSYAQAYSAAPAWSRSLQLALRRLMGAAAVLTAELSIALCGCLLLWSHNYPEIELDTTAPYAVILAVLSAVAVVALLAYVRSCRGYSIRKSYSTIMLLRKSLWAEASYVLLQFAAETMRGWVVYPQFYFMLLCVVLAVSITYVAGLVAIKKLYACKTLFTERGATRFGGATRNRSRADGAFDLRTVLRGLDKFGSYGVLLAALLLMLRTVRLASLWSMFLFKNTKFLPAACTIHAGGFALFCASLLCVAVLFLYENSRSHGYCVLFLALCFLTNFFRGLHDLFLHLEEVPRIIFELPTMSRDVGFFIIHSCSYLTVAAILALAVARLYQRNI